jgi:predicted RNase H-like HicB family nuclease
MQYTLFVQIEPLEEGGYLAICPSIPGCHAEGRSVGEALDNLREITRVLYDLSREKGLVFVPDYPNAKPDAILWQVQIPALEYAA